MHIVFVLPTHPSNCTLPDFWNYGFCQVNQATALVALGHDVTVLTRFSQDANMEREGINYCFVKDQYPAALRSWQCSAAIIEKLKGINPQVIHVHGLHFVFLLMRIRLAMPKSTQVFAEYHGDNSFRFPMNVLQRHSLRRITGLIFTNAQKADQASVQLRLPRDRFHYAVECAPDRKRTDRVSARQRTGFHGNPVIIWNSRAIARRHPDLVIDGYERYLQANPDGACQFYMMVPDYDADMLARIKSMSVRSERLKDHFTLIIDCIPQAAMTDYYNSADYIISGSENDPYGYGVVDAMSCGVIPIVTQSSTFLEITRNGEVGLLWDVTDPASLVDALSRIPTDAREIAKGSHDVLSVFNESLSMAAQGKSLERIYNLDTMGGDHA